MTDMTTLPASLRVVRLPDGHTVPYVEQGRRDGIPLILLHGLTDSLRSYEPVLAHLPDSIRAFAITQRGHGDAGKPAAGYSAADFAGDVVAFMDAVGVERAIIAGHSLGGWVARRVAAEHPERTAALVLAGCFAAFSDRPDMAGLLEEFRELSDPVDPAYARAWQESTLARPVPESFLETIVEETVKTPARVWTAVVENVLASTPEPPGTITAPTLIVWGDRDDYVPRSDQDALLAAISGARLAVYAGGGHAIHWEEPERYAADLVEFATR